MKLAKSGLENRLINFILKKDKIKTKEQIREIYEDRLKHEIDIINSMDYASYFLIVSDYIKWAKKILFRLVWQRFWSRVSSGLLFRHY